MAVRYEFKSVSQFQEANTVPGTDRYPDSLVFLVVRNDGIEKKNFKVSLGILKKYFDSYYQPIPD